MLNSDVHEIINEFRNEKIQKLLKKADNQKLHLTLAKLTICVVVVLAKAHLHKQLARGQNARSCSTVTITLRRVWAA
jgi:hypothetical protein